LKSGNTLKKYQTEYKPMIKAATLLLKILGGSFLLSTFVAVMVAYKP
jgi:hypothetical protein